MTTLLLAVYVGTMSLLALYGLHRWLMAVLFLRAWRRRPRPSSAPRAAVTVQLPVFNERFVVRRLIDAVAALRWPDLQIQVLDDSTDETTEIAAQAVEHWRDRGVDIELIHRVDREGFKAGALREGLATARGRFIAVFDADFVPQPEFLEEAMVWFAEDVGMVQARWGHINGDESLLTRVEAMLLDGHFVVEHTARNRTGRWFNFNGTAGIWRRQAIIDAGGWQHDTLTEDLDLSYRAQLSGWRFVYLPELVVPAELPTTMAAFRTQQHRWCKGSIQTLLKLGAALMSSPIGWRVRSEALVHLGSNLAYPLVLVLAVVNPFAVWIRGLHHHQLLWLDLLVFLFSSVGIAAFYAVSQWATRPDWGRRLLLIPATMALGIGLSVNQSRAVMEALLGRVSPFVRTPKGPYASVRRLPLAELALGTLHLAAVAWSLHMGWYQSVPLQLLFVFGFAYLSWGSLWKGAETSRAAAPATSSADSGRASIPSASSSSGRAQPATTSR